MTWHRRPFAAFDTETTGVDTSLDRVVTAAFLVIDGRRVDARTWLIDPGVDIPAEAAAVHGITTDHARTHGQPPAAALGEIRDALAWAWDDARVPVVVMNAPYDLTLLSHELRRHNAGALTVGAVIDPLVIDRGLDRYRRGGRKLTDLCAAYGVKHGDAHDAADDCLSAARVAWRLAERHPDVCGDVETLQTRQAEWHDEWAAHYETYLRTTGGRPDAVIPRGWPVTATLAAVA